MFRTKLARELAWVIAIKVVALTLLWAFFVRGHRTSVDDAGMATALRLNAVQSDNNARGGSHDQ
ncbi:MAG: hypothetical protein KGM40_05105 [Betaproteobacteria bacterium]|nr:hypothetical protein [Betaproteobacteria bacterium]MDE2624781.1 hypothetical protein [Betaproteobacteria bacterium]